MATSEKIWEYYTEKDLAKFMARNAGKFDCRLRVKNSVEIPTYKWILKQVSEPLKKLLEKPGADVIDIEWQPIEDVQLTIDYLHTKKLMDFNSREKVAEFANKFEIQPLMLKTIEIVIDGMSPCDVIQNLGCVRSNIVNLNSDDD